MSKFRLVLAVVIIFTLGVGLLPAQFGKRLGEAIKRRAEDVVTRKAEDATEKAIDTATDPGSYEGDDEEEYEEEEEVAPPPKKKKTTTKKSSKTTTTKKTTKKKAVVEDDDEEYEAPPAKTKAQSKQAAKKKGAADPNGVWDEQYVVLKDTKEAELMVRVGDVDAMNDPNFKSRGYDPFGAKVQYSHSYPWREGEDDPEGTDTIYVGTHYAGSPMDGYSNRYSRWKKGEFQGYAFGDGALTVVMEYDLDGMTVENAVLQLGIDDIQALTQSKGIFTVAINGKDAPFGSEILCHIDQGGPVANMVSIELPGVFLDEVRSGRLEISIDETKGKGEGYSLDFTKLLVNYKESAKSATVNGIVTSGGGVVAGATVRVLGTSNTVTTANSGKYSFKTFPGLVAVRASKSGYRESFGYGVAVAGQDVYYGYKPEGAENGNNERTGMTDLARGTGQADIDFSQFAAGDAWSEALASEGKIITYGITFDVGKATLKPEALSEINRVVKLMNDNPGLRFSVEGHTDSTGNAASNQKLSDARSKAVVDKLVELGIDASRLQSAGKGQTAPIADNDTEEGRAKNRRVEFVKL
jgi:outer membrane protein OmpA-like peptidoglycan-associated protein